MKSKTINKVSVGPLRGEEGLVTDDKEMDGILNAQYIGEGALSEMRFEDG